MNSHLTHLYLLFRRLLLAYVIFTFCRLLFLVFNSAAFSALPATGIISAFFYGLRFDTSAIMYVFSPLVILQLLPLNARNNKHYQLVTRLLFTLSAFISLLLNFIDVGYFAFSGKRSGMEMLRLQSAENASPLSYVADYWYLALLLLCCTWLSWKCYPALKQSNTIKKLKDFLIQSALFLAGASLAFLGARGGIGLKPLNTLDAARLTSPELMPLTLNTPFQFLLTLEQVGVDRKNYMSDEQAAMLFNPEKIAGTTGISAKKNIVLLIVESLGKEYVGYYNNGKGYTPFLDSLMQHSTVYTNAYANGKRSIEGIPAILAAMPGWMQGDLMNSFYKSNRLHSTGYHLAKQGYDVSFYHGGKNGTMSFDQFVANTGAGKYYGLNEYPDRQRDFDGTWGIYDEPYLQYFCKELGKKTQPFYSTLFTLSSHHPYKLPSQYAGKFKGGRLPIHATIQYADFALEQFFAAAKTQRWYANTLFVVIADHSSENQQQQYLTSAGKYAVPFFIFDPSSPVKQEINATISQLNICDEIINHCLPAGTPYFSFANKYAIQYDNGIYQLIDHPFVLKFDGERTSGFYNIQTDTFLRKNLIADEQVKPKRDSLELYLKAVIQQYNNRLIDNKTY